jgi:hypothetical protein
MLAKLTTALYFLVEIIGHALATCEANVETSLDTSVAVLANSLKSSSLPALAARFLRIYLICRP